MHIAVARPAHVNGIVAGVAHLAVDKVALDYGDGIGIKCPVGRLCHAGFPLLLRRVRYCLKSIKNNTIPHDPANRTTEAAGCIRINN